MVVLYNLLLETSFITSYIWCFNLLFFMKENLEIKSNKKDAIEKLAFGLLIAVVFIVAFNIFQLSKLNNNDNTITDNSVVNTVSSIDVIPKGIPEIYGKELGISFDDVSAFDSKKADSTIKKLGSLDENIMLSGADLERYISIVSKISCEYCCGADSIIFSDGKPSCGCAHSFAMRGLAKYLIKNHGNEYSDDEILEELGKWKTLFFPTQISSKAKVLKEKGIELNYINLASNKYRDIEKNSGGGMVGGC